MSSMAALALFAAAASQAPSGASTEQGITAEQAMAHYLAMTSGVIVEKASDPCPEGVADQIVVCARRHLPPPRLPFPEARFEPGEVVRHPSEPGLRDQGPPGAPSRLGETLQKGFHLLKSVFTGEDPVD